MTVYLEGTPKGELEIKRCYLPGVTQHVECPICKHVEKRDFDGDSFNYPEMNTPMKLHFYCQSCNHEWSEIFLFQVRLIWLGKDEISGGK